MFLQGRTTYRSPMDIFVVDDERLIGETLAIILRRKGYTVQAFTNPSAALAACHLNPRLLLTDYSMPLVSGTDLVRAFRQRSPQLAAVVLSAALEESDPEWCSLVTAGPNTELLRKPLHPLELLRYVVRAIGEPTIQETHSDISPSAAMTRSELSYQPEGSSRFSTYPFF